MSESRHTPLPWKADGPEVFALDADGNFNCHVATAWSFPYLGPGSDEAVANAALIVRAANDHADLLAACEAAERDISRKWANDTAYCDPVLAQLRAAVAKARSA